MYRIGKDELEEVARVIESRQLFRKGNRDEGHLLECDRFEQEWAEKIGTKYALLMCGGGTAALVCALAGIGVGPGDEVIVPAYTWMATATSVLTVGAIPVLAEVDETMALDPGDFERRIGPNTRAVIPVHMMGRPAAMDRITAIARQHGLKVVEDSCQMDGGSYKGKRTGSWGDVGAFSFNWYKIISSGEGGCLVTSDRSIYETAIAYSDSGTVFRPQASELSIPIFVAQQYRADEIMGAILRVQLQRMDGIIADLRERARKIEVETEGINGLRVAPNNDFEGDCGVGVAYQFSEEAQARTFKDNVGMGSYVGIDHGKHVFTEWEPLIAKRIMHRPDMNPFNFPKNQGLRADYTAETCPRTLDLLRRTVFFPVNPDWTEAETESVIASIKDAGAKAAQG